MAPLTLEIIGIPKGGRVRGNMWNEIFKNIIEDKFTRLKKEEERKRHSSYE